MANTVLQVKLDVGNPHVRLDGENVARAATPRRGSPLTIRLSIVAVLLSLTMTLCCGVAYATPFWYNDAAPATNRVAASSDSFVSSSATEFRMLSVVEAVGDPFDTFPFGMILIVR